MYDVAVVGGGLAGIIHSILLARRDHRVVLIEKKSYPFHRVCGEYISNEVVPFLKSEGLYPDSFEPAQINEFVLSSTKGRRQKLRLPLGGFGISRYTFDHWLIDQARASGVEVKTSTQVNHIKAVEGGYELEISAGDPISAKVAVGAQGKRAKLDQTLDRGFMRKRSPFMGIKYHIETDQVAPNAVELHNFYGGYCGVSRVENNQYNLCYLTERANLKHTGSIEEMEATILSRNPNLSRLLKDSNHLFSEPVVINEFTFQPKEQFHQGLFMIGDAAGLITPLCGNGMALAIHSAKLLAEILDQELTRPAYSEKVAAARYQKAWRRLFARRLWAGRQIQGLLFGTPGASNLAVSLSRIRPVAQFLIRQTHGKPF